MISDQCEQVPTLLKELSVLKGLNPEYEASLKNRICAGCYGLRQQASRRWATRLWSCGTETEEQRCCTKHNRRTVVLPRSLVMIEQRRSHCDARHSVDHAPVLCSYVWGTMRDRLLRSFAQEGQ
jgi:hypothetical protein